LTIRGYSVNDTEEKEQSLSRIVSLLKKNDPASAEKICREYLLDSPGCVDHLRMLSHACLKQHRSDDATETLQFAISLKPDFAPLHEDLGAIFSGQGRLKEAIATFEKAIQLDPTRPTAHKKLGQVLAASGRGQEADDAFETFFAKDTNKGIVAEGLEHFRAGRLDQAVDVLRGALKKGPKNVDAMHVLAVTYIKQDKRRTDAEALLRRAIHLAPDFMGASLTLGTFLTQSGKAMDATKVLEEAVSLNGEVAEAWACLGGAYALAGYPDKSAAAYARSIELVPDVPGTQMSLAHSLKTLGDQEGALRAYRQAAVLNPQFGETYWSMANLKIFEFEEAEVTEMENQLEHSELSDVSDIHFRFALGKAFEDRKDYDKAWHYYHSGNQKQRARVGHDPVVRELLDKRIIEVFDEDFMRMNENNGYEAPDPIFIVSLPRSGSTLVEQILASHSQVEGTAELTELSQISNSIGKYSADKKMFPESVRKLTRRDWRAYGKEYLDRTRRHRITDKPFFTDKMPNNFPLLGFACLAMPNAKFINARRHPLDSCLGSYKQLFGKGQHFTYDMTELSMYYEEYDAMIKHWHKLMPGRVLDVHYEETVTDLEGQVRRILEHCGLPFEEQCLRFYDSDRAVKTASSEQVRQPIYKGALGKWRKYEAHLDEWKEQLAPILDELPEVVQNAGK
jgi:tetratricopeptide (TPR) repeat protein